MRFDLHAGTALREMLRRRDDLWRAEIRNAINDLAREVRKFDRVRVDEAELEHSSAYKGHRRRHAKAANSDNQHAIIRQLAHLTKPIEAKSERPGHPARKPISDDKDEGFSTLALSSEIHVHESLRT